MKRNERLAVFLPGGTTHIDVEVLICNRCGATVPAQHAKERAWVGVLSDGRGGRHIDFCGPAHAAEYFAELVPRDGVPDPLALCVLTAAPATG